MKQLFNTDSYFRLAEQRADRIVRKIRMEGAAFEIGLVRIAKTLIAGTQAIITGGFGFGGSDFKNLR